MNLRLSALPLVVTLLLVSVCQASQSEVSLETLLGTLPGYGFHHELVEKPNGNLIIAVNKADAETIEDHVVELNRESGEIVKVWDFRNILDMNRRDFDASERDWLHINAVYYDETDNAIIVSGRNQGLAKVTYDDELVWLLAPHQGWGRAGSDADGQDTAEFLLTAVDADGEPYPEAVQQGTEGSGEFDWVWGQHAPTLLPNGNLFVFDNGLGRYFADGEPRFSRGVEYAVDEVAMTVEQVWQYGAERGDAFYASIISDVDYLPETGNRLVMPGVNWSGEPFYALVTEVTYPKAEVVFEAQINFKNLRSTSDELDWGQFDLVYRSERLPLYPR